MQKIKVCKVSDLRKGKSIERRFLARKIVVFNDDGHIYAMEAECKHMKAPLNLGKVENGIVTCHWHHWKYELKSGKCLTKEHMDLRKFAVEIEDDYIFVVFDF